VTIDGDGEGKPPKTFHTIETNASGILVLDKSDSGGGQEAAATGNAEGEGEFFPGKL
jgi:hypothetical protein